MTAAVDGARTLHVEHCMGTVFSIDVRDVGDWRDAIAEVVAWLRRVDAVFSTYKHDSDISRLQRRELRLDDADPLVIEVLDLCARVQAETHGYFTAMPEGKLDPTGLVKGWAIERASELLRAHGSSNHAVNGGGDVQLAGEAAPGQPWRVGIADPRARDRLVTAVTGSGFAVATSGTAERGQHVVDPFTGEAPGPGYLSATVVGPSLTRADAYATAAFIMGPHALRWAEGQDGFETLLITDNGRIVASSGWHDWVAPDTA